VAGEVVDDRGRHPHRDAGEGIAHHGIADDGYLGLQGEGVDERQDHEVHRRVGLEPDPSRSMSQWFIASNSSTVRTWPHVQ